MNRLNQNQMPQHALPQPIHHPRAVPTRVDELKEFSPACDKRSSSDDRDRLKEFLIERSVMRGKFTLASGTESTEYVDCKRTTLFSMAMPLVGRLILEVFRTCGWQPEVVGGLTMGADPIACSVARESLERGVPLNAFSVRKEAKDHGRRRAIEGIERPSGLRCVVVDDVCTTGDSTLQAVRRAKEAGMHVLGACCIVDREQGAREALADEGCEFKALYTMAELLGD